MAKYKIVTLWSKNEKKWTFRPKMKKHEVPWKKWKNKKKIRTGHSALLELLRNCDRNFYITWLNPDRQARLKKM